MQEKIRGDSLTEEKKYCFPYCSCSWWKIVICVVVGLMIVVGAVYAGYFLGRRSLSPRELLIPPKPITTQIPINNGPVVIEVSSTPEVKSDETANWKTYTSREGKFLFKYPQSWPYVKGKIYQGDILAGTLEKAHFGTSDPQADNKPDEVIAFMAVYKNSPTFGKNPEEYFQKITDSVDPATKREIIVGVVSGIRAFVKGAYPSSDTVVIGKGDYLYRFELLDSKATNKYKKENEHIFDQILSTFKFLD